MDIKFSVIECVVSLGITLYIVKGRGSERFPRQNAFYKVKGMGHAQAHHWGLPSHCD